MTLEEVITALKSGGQGMRDQFKMALGNLLEAEKVDGLAFLASVADGVFEATKILDQAVLKLEALEGLDKAIIEQAFESTLLKPSNRLGKRELNSQQLRVEVEKLIEQGIDHPREIAVVLKIPVARAQGIKSHISQDRNRAANSSANGASAPEEKRTELANSDSASGTASGGSTRPRTRDAGDLTRAEVHEKILGLFGEGINDTKAVQKAMQQRFRIRNTSGFMIAALRRRRKETVETTT